MKKSNRNKAPLIAAMEALEARQLMSVSLLATKAGSELHPTTTGRGVFTFSRTGSKTDALVVDYSVDTANTTAPAGDYASLPGSVTIPAGKPSVTVVINPLTEGSAAKTETLALALGTSSAYTINTKHADAVLKIAVPKTLAKTEDTVSITASVANASEASPSTVSSGQYTVTRTGPTTADLTVGYTIDSSSTAVVGTDYNALTGSVTIPAHQSMATITVTPIVTTTHAAARTVTADLVGLGYFVSPTASNATVTITDTNSTGGGGGGGGTTPSTDWFVNDTYRNVVNVDSGSYARTDEPVSQSINFTQLLAAQGKSGALDDGSIQVVEVTQDGSTEINSTVPFEFDHASGYDATTNASGTLTILASGSTAANTTRYFQVYFNTTTAYTAPTITSQITVTQNVTDAAGNNADEIQTPSATYYVETADGGIADIIDSSQNDWVSYSNASGAAGQYHGVPNVDFHPGIPVTSMTTTVESSGPLVATITASSPGDSITYLFYPNFVKATINQEATNPYTFLYEGTPGGSVNSNDTWAISDGTTGTLANDMPEPDSDGNGGVGEVIGQSAGTGEWAYFTSAAAGKYIYFAHDNGTPALDSYFDYNGQMTVFGFGRSRSTNGGGGNYLYTTTPESVTFGLESNSGAFSTNAATINGQYRDISATAGAVQIESTGS